jgi:TfoX/Sxy family transcriptional regulator of competence genes
MATSKNFAAYVEDALSHISKLRVKAMFGEYAVYCGDVVVGLICDETLFIKITGGTRQLLDAQTEMAPPYTGAKPAFVLPESVLEDRELIKQVVSVCRDDLAAKKKPSRPRRRKQAHAGTND